MLPFMISSLLFHPATTFAAGMILALGATGLLLSSCGTPGKTEAAVSAYRAELAKQGQQGPPPGSPGEKAAITRFTDLLTKISDPAYIRAHTRETYAEDAFLNDTLVTRRGAAQIEAYFLKTSEAMKEYHVTIDDVSRSGPDHYVRWTMVVSAPALDKGRPVHSIGISQVRFNAEGKVVLHQDFWDSGEAFFGRLPVAGGIISVIRKRLE